MAVALERPGNFLAVKVDQHHRHMKYAVGVSHYVQKDLENAGPLRELEVVAPQRNVESSGQKLHVVEIYYLF